MLSCAVYTRERNSATREGRNLREGVDEDAFRGFIFGKSFFFFFTLERFVLNLFLVFGTLDA